MKRKFVGFKDNTPEDEVKEKFREKISEYLQMEFDKATEDADVLQKQFKFLKKRKYLNKKEGKR